MEKKREFYLLSKAFHERETELTRKYEVMGREQQRLRAALNTFPIDVVTLELWKQCLRDMAACWLEMAQERKEVIDRSLDLICKEPAAGNAAVVTTVAEPAAKRVKTEP